MPKIDTSSVRHFILPYFVLNDERFSPLDIKVYSILYTFSGPDIQISNEELSNFLNVSPSSISNSISNLSKLGLLSLRFEIKEGGGKIRFINSLVL